MPTVTGSALPAADRPTRNLNVLGTRPLIPPLELHRQLPPLDPGLATVHEGRDTIRSILRGRDPRLLVVVGPCSIHDPEAAVDYARRLVALKHRLADRLYIVMRVYFEKPRTTTGWKGLINDPHLDGSFDMAEGLRRARRVLIEFTRLGLPAGTEFLDPFTPQYLGDLIAWAAVGARTTESQTHRQMASGLSMPVGYKNATGGDLQAALDAMTAARSPHHFLGIDEGGQSCVVQTRGNVDGHVILRGGKGRPNYHPQFVHDAARRLREAGLSTGLMIDCSHANSGKQSEAQATVWDSLIDQRASHPPGCGSEGPGGGSPILGAMLESNLASGKQEIPSDLSSLRYGVSVTDDCLGWEDTERLLIEGAKRLGEGA